jgi:hypothetical protein
VNPLLRVLCATYKKLELWGRFLEACELHQTKDININTSAPQPGSATTHITTNSRNPLSAPRTCALAPLDYRAFPGKSPQERGELRQPRRACHVCCDESGLDGQTARRAGHLPNRTGRPRRPEPIGVLGCCLLDCSKRRRKKRAAWFVHQGRPCPAQNPSFRVGVEAGPAKLAWAQQTPAWSRWIASAI